jgi:hypothetical protein
MNYLDASHQLEQLACHMSGAASTRRPEADFAGIPLRVSNKLGNRLG